MVFRGGIDGNLFSLLGMKGGIVWRWFLRLLFLKFWDNVLGFCGMLYRLCFCCLKLLVIYWVLVGYWEFLVIGCRFWRYWGMFWWNCCNGFVNIVFYLFRKMYLLFFGCWGMCWDRIWIFFLFLNNCCLEWIGRFVDSFGW